MEVMYGLKVEVGDLVYSMPSNKYSYVEICKVVGFKDNDIVMVQYLEHPKDKPSRKTSRYILKIVAPEVMQKWLIKRELKK